MTDPELTILALPKPFRGHIGVIQRNAITSWTKLHPRPQIYLLGCEEGIAEIAAELQVHQIRHIAKNEFGTPLLNDLLERGRQSSPTTLLCYVNSDIILLQEFLDAAVSVSHNFREFLCVAYRQNVDVAAPLVFDETWPRALVQNVVSRGSGGEPSAIDVFVFNRDLYTDVPAFVLGRAWFDQWMIKDARTRNVPVVDLTLVARAIHQNHEYSHIEGGQKAAYWGEEARRNLALYGGVPHAYTLLNATYELLPSGQFRRVRFRRQRAALARLLWKAVIAPTAELRKKLGLRRARHVQKDRTAKA